MIYFVGFCAVQLFVISVQLSQIIVLLQRECGE
jgi:hypothetical protein